VGEAFWERQGTLKLWIPILTSTAVLWFGISVLAIVAGVRKRRQRAAQAKAMEDGEIPAAGPNEAPPPDEIVN
jgi:xanthine dehydrogenase molybdopterin-binding subunit B